MSKSNEMIVVEVQPRAETGKNACRRIRAAGMIPGNVYGLEIPPFMVAVDPKRIDALLRLESGVNTVFTLSLPGESQRREAMIKELQRDPVSERALHVDFVRLDVTKPVQVSVPVRLVGEPIGVKQESGIVDFVHREVQVECLPQRIPEHIDVDISGLHINQNTALKSVEIPEGVRILDDPEQIIAVVMPPRVEEEEAPTEEEAAEAAAEGEGEAAEGKEGEGEKASGDEKK